MPIKTSEEAFNESIAKGEETAKKNAERSKQIRELREQMNQLVSKATFTNSEYDKQRFSAEAQALKRKIDYLVNGE